MLPISGGRLKIAIKGAEVGLRLFVSGDATARRILLGVLPDDFQWRLDDRYGHHWLLCNGREVALVNKVSEGRWKMGVNRQRWSGKGHGYVGTLTHAKRMVERWAAVNAERLRREVLDRNLSNPPSGDSRLSRAELRVEYKLRS